VLQGQALAARLPPVCRAAWDAENAICDCGASGLIPASPVLALLRPLAAARDDVMHHEMRDISADLKERADLLRAQIDSAQARFQAVITELNK
jgi:hypothetical protein